MQKSTASHKAYERLKREISEGLFSEGERLKEAVTAERLGISATPVREAFKRLEREGFIESVPYKGVVVKRHSLEGVRHAYLARARLEALALKLALEKMSDEDAVHLERIITEGAASTGVHPLARFVPFHEWVIQKADSRVVYSMLESIIAQINIHRATRHLLNLDAPRFIQAHIDLAACVKNGHHTEAERLMECIILETFKGLVH